MRAELRGPLQLHRDAALRKNISATRFVVSLLVSREAKELREATGDFSTVENLVDDAEIPRHLDGARDEVRLAVVRGLSGAWRHDQNPAIIEQHLSGICLQLAPDPVGVEDQRRVVTALADGLPREAGFSVARPHLVR